MTEETQASTGDLVSDVALIHPPYIVQREHYPIFPIPWNLDHVGSTRYMEPYPIGPRWARMPAGFQTIKHYIEQNSPFRVSIHNVSTHINDLKEVMRSFADPGGEELPAVKSLESYISRLKADVYAVGLHWVVHSHGAIELLRMIKEIHPDSCTVIGGLSATYFREEIMQSFPFIDCAIGGDGAVPLHRLVQCVKNGGDFSQVPNLIYREKGLIKRGPVEPLNDFEACHAVETSTISLSRGCPLECVTCGGSKSASRNVWSYESIEIAVIDRVLEKIAATCRGNGKWQYYFFHDPLVTLGAKNWHTLLDEIERNNFNLRFRLEFYLPHPREELIQIARCAPGSEIHYSPESMDPGVRDYHKNLSYSNEELIMNMDIINSLEELSMQVWFMAGVARDNEVSIETTLDFIEQYHQRLRNKKLDIIKYNEMLFIDPGSLAFEDPRAYDYRLLNKSFLEHRESFVMPLFKYQINYEMLSLNRDSLFKVFLKMHNRMNRIYLESGIINKRLHARALKYNILLEKYAPLYDEAIKETSSAGKFERFEALGEHFWEDLIN